MGLEEIWTERELAEKLGLPTTKAGKSIQIGNWIRGGLRYAEKSGRRYFFESDVVEYLKMRRSVTMGDEPETTKQHSKGYEEKPQGTLFDRGIEGMGEECGTTPVA